jgi:hypothetical protein
LAEPTTARNPLRERTASGWLTACFGFELTFRFFIIGIVGVIADELPRSVCRLFKQAFYFG